MIVTKKRLFYKQIGSAANVDNRPGSARKSMKAVNEIPPLAE